MAGILGLSFLLDDQRVVNLFGFGLAFAPPAAARPVHHPTSTIS
jgi:hypothetical protein